MPHKLKQIWKYCHGPFVVIFPILLSLISKVKPFTLVTVCTTYFKIKTLHFTHTLFLRVSRNKQRLFPQAALTGWAL
jgi:hypothetical protein